LIIELNRLRNPELSPIQHMGYTGYIVQEYTWGEKDSRRRIRIWYHHGVGGSSPVTKGMIDFNRAVVANEADIYWMGHKHVASVDPSIHRLHLDKFNNEVMQVHKGFYTAGYKGGVMHKQLGKYGYVPDYSTEKFLNHSSFGGIFMNVYMKSTWNGTSGNGYVPVTDIRTSRS
jgi:hypothetical protein